MQDSQVPLCLSLYGDKNAKRKKQNRFCIDFIFLPKLITVRFKTEQIAEKNCA
jgi:hypothetical protein